MPCLFTKLCCLLLYTGWVWIGNPLVPPHILLLISFYSSSHFEDKNPLPGQYLGEEYIITTGHKSLLLVIVIRMHDYCQAQPKVQTKASAFD